MYSNNSLIDTLAIAYCRYGVIVFAFAVGLNSEKTCQSVHGSLRLWLKSYPSETNWLAMTNQYILRDACELVGIIILGIEISLPIWAPPLDKQTRQTLVLGTPKFRQTQIEKSPAYKQKSFNVQFNKCSLK